MPHKNQAGDISGVLQYSDADIRVIKAYKHVFDSDFGALVLDDLKLEYCGPSFVPGVPDHTSWNEGRRSVVLDIEAILAMKLPEQTHTDNKETEADAD